MDSFKAQELKDDAVLDIKVNKTFYMMCKASLFTLFKEVHDISKGSPKEFINNLTSKPYLKLNEKEKIFYTLTLIIGEIERKAAEKDLFIEKEITKEDLKKDIEKLKKASED